MKEYRSENSKEKYRILIPTILGISHEIRNPLQGILAAVTLLNEHPKKDPLISRLARIFQNESSRIDLIIQRLLEFTQVIQFDLQNQSLMSLISAAVRSVQNEISSKQAVVNVKVPDDLPKIKADGQRFPRAIAEIILNSIDSKATGAQVMIQVKKEMDQIMISIVDDGCGMSEEILLNAFEPFFSSKTKNPGLGLCIAERIILAHNGDILIRSDLTAGTEVVVHLPIAI
jgi:signal transduction histidine kinase